MNRAAKSFVAMLSAVILTLPPLNIKAEEVRTVYKENFETHYIAETLNATLGKNGNYMTIEENNENKYFNFVRKDKDALVYFPAIVNEDYFIVEFDVSSDTINGEISINLRDSNAVAATLVSFSSTGEAAAANGTVIGQLTNQMQRFKFKINQSTQRYDAYINDTVVLTDIPFNNREFTSMVILHLYFFNRGTGNNLKLDNILIYTGNGFKTADELGGYSNDFLKSDEYAVSQALGGTAFHIYSDYMVKNGEKIKLSSRPLQDNNGNLWITSEIIGTTDLDVTTKTVGNTKYMLLSEVAEALNLNYYEDTNGYGYNKGFGIIGNADFSAFADDFLNYNELNNYLVYERPSVKQIVSDYNNSTVKGQHPRLFATENDFVLLKEELKTNTEKKAWADKIISYADSYLSADLPTAGLNGPRLSSIHQIQAPIFNLCMAYRLTDGDKSVYAEKAFEVLEVFGERENWNPWHFLDVGVGTTSFALVYDWMYDYWSNDTAKKEYLEKAMLEKSLAYVHMSLHSNTYSNWLETVAEGNTGNWPIVCLSGPVMASAVLMDVYPEVSAQIVSDALRALEYTLKGFADNGDWSEGPLYWAYTNKYLAYLTDTCMSVFGTDYGHYFVPGMEKTVSYCISLMGANGAFNFGDASENSAIDTETFSWHASMLSDKYNEYASELNKFTLHYFDKNNKSGGFWDILRMDNETVSGEPEVLEREYYSDKMGIGIMRSSWEWGSETFLGYVRGTKERMSHEHVDHGSFVFDWGGERWISDLGRDDYNINDYANSAYRRRAEGHNVYVINPDEGVGQLENQYGNYLVRKEHNDISYYSIEDISSSYAAWANSARRGYKLTDNFNSLLVRDEISLKENSDFYSFFHTSAEVECSGNTAYLTKNGKSVKFEFLSNQPLTLSVMDAVPLDSSPVITYPFAYSVGNNPNIGYKKLVLRGSVEGNLEITVKLSGVTDSEIEPLEAQSLESWSLDHLTGEEKISLKAVTVNSLDFTEFNPDIYEYSVNLLENDTSAFLDFVPCDNSNLAIYSSEDKIRVVVNDKAYAKEPAEYVFNLNYGSYTDYPSSYNAEENNGLVMGKTLLYKKENGRFVKKASIGEGEYLINTLVKNISDKASCGMLAARLGKVFTANEFTVEPNEYKMISLRLYINETAGNEKLFVNLISY